MIDLTEDSFQGIISPFYELLALQYKLFFAYIKQICLQHQQTIIIIRRLEQQHHLAIP